ncbi:hypothetical protein GCM10009099_29450 [Caenispirillum bisanense]
MQKTGRDRYPVSRTTARPHARQPMFRAKFRLIPDRSKGFFRLRPRPEGPADESEPAFLSTVCSAEEKGIILPICYGSLWTGAAALA